MTHSSPTPLSEARRLVIKTGSSLVINAATGTGRTAWMASLAADIAQLQQAGQQVILVSSGAVALGRQAMGMTAKPKLEEKQAAAACGQPLLMQAWAEAFAAQGLRVAQLLLTLDDSEHRRRYLNARATLETLLAHGIIPIINENDTVATAELRVGDNDRLAARVAQMSGADMLVLLSDVDGLYTANPATDPKAQHIPMVEQITDTVRAFAAPPSSAVGTGGMVTKIMAAELALSAGCHTLLTLGTPEHPLARLSRDEARGTWFVAATTPRSARKDWIAGSLAPQGELVVDDGAAAALAKGNSLLPAGVSAVSGDFQRGDAVLVLDRQHHVLAKGLCAYNADDARRIAGQNSKNIEQILGFKGRDEIIHRDDLVLL
jgi:glutamate 5-kinase